MTTTSGGTKDFTSHNALIYMKNGVFYGSPEADAAHEPTAAAKGLSVYLRHYRLVRPEHPPLAGGVVDPILEEAFGGEKFYLINGNFTIKGPNMYLTSWPVKDPWTVHEFLRPVQASKLRNMFLK